MQWESGLRNYNRQPVPKNTLYFAYTALLDPERISSIAPGAEFLFTAHYPETRLDFVADGPNGAVPTLVHDPAHTVWGGVFDIPEGEIDSLVVAEKEEGRVEGFDNKAVDRAGNKHDCLTFVATTEPNGDHRPSQQYLDAMVRGAKHWSLPAGWVMGLEDLGEDPLFA